MAREPGEPFARDEIDPDLVKLSRPRSKVGVITAVGLVVLCVASLVHLLPDLRFSQRAAEPTPATVADILAGKVASDALITLPAEPLRAHAIRATASQGSLGHRVVPVRGTGDRLWLVLPGSGWDPPTTTGYVGRLRKLDDLGFAAATRAHAATHPRAVFAPAAAVRAGFAGGTVATVSGDPVTLADADPVALDVVEPASATLVATFNERLPDTAAWRAALGRAGLTVTDTASPDPSLGQVRFTVAAAVAAATAKLEAAELWAARVEPVTRHHRTTWGALRASPPAGFDVGGKVIADADLELVGLYPARPIPADAYALVTDERPDDYWYVLPIALVLAVIVLVFAWAGVRAVRRDLVPARA